MLWQARRGLIAGRGALDASAGFTPTSTESSNFLARATTITDNTDKTRYDALISGLVADGDFTKLDALKIWAAPDRTAAVLNLVQNAYNDTENGTVSFSAAHGYTGNATDFYLDSGFNPFSASSPQYVLDSASVGVYVLTNSTSGGGNGYNTDAVNVGRTSLSTFYFSNSYWCVNNASQRSPASTTSQGLWIATRTSANDIALYRNGNTTPFDSNNATTSDFVPRENLKFFGTSLFSDSQMSACFIGSGLSSAAMARIAARINTFHTAYGINVY